MTEEWVVRDEAAIVEQLGFDLQTTVDTLAASGNRGVLGHTGSGLLGPPPTDPLARGDSGPKPGIGKEEATLALDLFRGVWNDRMFQRVTDLVHPAVIVHSQGRRTAVRHDGYVSDLLRLPGAFPDAVVGRRQPLRLSRHEGGRPVAPQGTYGGAPIYGPVTHSPVDVLGCSMFRLRDGRVYREWRVHDDIAVRAQIARARTEAAA